MSPRTKSILLLLVTLVLGVVLGALLNARLAQERMERIAFLRSQRGFMRFLEDVVEPESPEQRQAVRDVLRRSAQRMAEVREQHRAEMQSILDSTRTELEGVLTDRQLEQLEQRLEMHRMNHRRGRGGPPPHRGPPPGP